MTFIAARVRHTPEDLLTMPDGDRYELVHGGLVEREMGTEASWIAGQLFKRIALFVDEARLGHALPADAAYQCFAEEPERIRRPDVSFIPRGLLSGERLPRGHARVVPALVVEVISPNDLFTAVREKVFEYLRAGVQLVWVVDPEHRTVEVARADGSFSLLRAEEEVSGEDVIPGFRCRVGDIFPE